MKNLIRKWLGLAEIDTKLAELERDTSSLRSSAVTIRQDYNRLKDGTHSRTAAMKQEMQELGIMLSKVSSALGGIWTCADGSTLPIRLLSDTHLASIMRGKYGSQDKRDLVKAEQERRNSDDEWARRSNRLSTRDRLTQLEVLATLPPGSPRAGLARKRIFDRTPRECMEFKEADRIEARKLEQKAAQRKRVSQPYRATRDACQDSPTGRIKPEHTHGRMCEVDYSALVVRSIAKSLENLTADQLRAFFNQEEK